MLCKCKMILMKGNILQRAKNKTATLLREKKYELLFSEHESPEVDPPC